MAVYITQKLGGNEAVKEATDLILEVWGKLQEALNANFGPRLLNKTTGSLSSGQ
jgi:hypothetical protein